MVSGQKPMAPKTASISLKEGMDIANTVVTFTNVDLQMTFKTFILVCLKGSHSIIGASWTMTLLAGHFPAAHVSTVANIGCEKTYF